jgi:hypothetical protein
MRVLKDARKVALAQTLAVTAEHFAGCSAHL